MNGFSFCFDCASFHPLKIKWKYSPGSLEDYWTKDHEMWHDASGLQCIERPASIQQNTRDRSRRRCSPTETHHPSVYFSNLSVNTETLWYVADALVRHLLWSTAFCRRCHHLWGVSDLMRWGKVSARAEGQDPVAYYSRNGSNRVRYTPTLWATNSSCRTDELASIWIQSIAANTQHRSLLWFCWVTLVINSNNNMEGEKDFSLV